MMLCGRSSAERDDGRGARWDRGSMWVTSQPPVSEGGGSPRSGIFPW